MTDLPRNIERDLAALADGSLTSKRREAALGHAGASPELGDALAEQRRAVDLFASVEVRAPSSLHGKVEQLVAGAAPKRRPSGARIGLASAFATAVATAAIAIGLSGGGAEGLSVRKTAALALSPAKMTAPGESETHRAQLTATVGGVPFPYWKERFGWRSSGARTDRVAGRAVTTVFYTNAQRQRIGYAIASGRAPATWGGTVTKRWGVSYRVLAQDGATVVTWQRDGHLCVVAGRGVSARTLLGLASWGSGKTRAA
jgi:hypothetical protein